MAKHCTNEGCSYTHANTVEWCGYPEPKPAVTVERRVVRQFPGLPKAYWEDLSESEVAELMAWMDRHQYPAWVETRTVSEWWVAE